ncbi:hypothetical protein H1R20_g2732, partial [Candolleomyces eurysporus]
MYSENEMTVRARESAHMPPKPKETRIKSIVDGFGSLFSSKRSRRNEQPIAHDLPTVEDVLRQSGASPLLQKHEGSTVSAAIPATETEHPLPSHSDVGPSKGASAQTNSSLAEHTGPISMFSNAQRFNVENVINIDSSSNVQNVQGNRIDGWKMLLKNIASNALHDSSARFDPPKCDDDTRVEVTNELMDWIQDRESPQRLLCMTGAAGAGKSALQQTIAEKCATSSILGSAFFFNAGDPTRNNLTHIAPTIACQLGLRHSALRDTIAKAIEEDPLIFKKTLRIQMDTLVVGPFKKSSRPEWAMRSALDSEPEGYLYQQAYHLKLSDIRSRDRQTQSHLWPTEQDIEKLVAAASGQFVYAATVVKYVSERRSSPVDRLRTIIDWTPEGSQQTSRPFELLDILYRNILSTAKELYEAVDTNEGRDFLLLVRAHQMNSDFRIGRVRDSTRNFDEIISLEEGGHQVLFSDLHSLVFLRQDPRMSEGWEEMRFYHRSFSEFLDSEFRAQHLFVSEARVRQYVVESCLQKLLQREDFLSELSFYSIVWTLFRYSKNRTTCGVDLRSLIDFTRNNGWGVIDERLPSHVEMDRVNNVHWYGLAHFTFDSIQHLNDDLHEHELADIVKSYFDKWKERYEEYGFTEKN